MRKVTARLSMATHTPIPHWLSLPWLETCAWYATVAGIQKDDAPNGDG